VGLGCIECSWSPKSLTSIVPEKVPIHWHLWSKKLLAEGVCLLRNAFSVIFLRPTLVNLGYFRHKKWPSDRLYNASPLDYQKQSFCRLLIEEILSRQNCFPLHIPDCCGLMSESEQFPRRFSRLDFAEKYFKRTPGLYTKE